MNIDYLYECMEAMSYGMTKIGNDDLIILKNSLSLLKIRQRFEKVFYWGRINNNYAPFDIAFGTREGEAVPNKYFYTRNLFDWHLLPYGEGPFPPYSIRAAEIASRIETVTKGDSYRDDNNCRCRRADHLADMCQRITNTCGIVPRGYLYKTHDSNVIYNPLFEGLDENEAADWKNYYILRHPTVPMSHHTLSRPDYNKSYDFLDSILDIQPSQYAFSMQFEDFHRLVVIRSLLYPGMTFIHRINTKIHGFVYIGNLSINLDLLFQLASYLSEK